MAAVRRESLFARHASAANKWTNRHKKARRSKSLRYRDFIRKSVGCIKIGCDAVAASRTPCHRHGPDFRREQTSARHPGQVSDAVHKHKSTCMLTSPLGVRMPSQGI